MLSTARGLWARDGGTFVNIRTPRREHTLGEMYLYEIDAHRRLVRFTHAAGASSAAEGWHLEGILDSRLGDRSVTTERVGARTWTTSLDPQELQVLFMPAEELSVIDLYQSITSLRTRGESPRRHQLAFWRRITMPAVCGIMVLLGIPFVLAAPRGITIGQRIVGGALTGVGFEMASATFGRLGLVYGIPPVLSALLPAALALAAFLIWMRRTYW